MKQILLCVSLTIATFLAAQSTFQEVYSIFQTNCASSYCHSGGSAAAGLDLEGLGATIADKQTDVYNNLYKEVPSNSFAQAKNNYLVYPGDPYRSYLFRKINNGLSDDVPLEANEGSHMPATGVLSDYEKEVIRQWILYGAKETGNQVNLTTVSDYYQNPGLQIQSVNNIPAPPDPSEGFQIHLGPFFLAPEEEVEFFSKYETLLPNPIEITKYQTEMGTYSHHFIVYSFTSSFGNVDPNNVPYGMRPIDNFDGKTFALTEQYSNTLETPQGSAFKWQDNTVLDLNTHYINYSDTKILKADVYLNVYTQPNGTAAQEMRVQLIPETSIYIPNNSQEHSFETDLTFPGNLNIFLWGLVAHTHKYGKDFNIYTLSNGQVDEQIYDGGCANGLPGCGSEYFDYQHLPIRFIEPFKMINMTQGIRAEATFLNDGPAPVQWGLTSDDEMMIFVAMFTLDTTGVSFENDSNSTALNTILMNELKLAPNPTKSMSYLNIQNELELGTYHLELFNVDGKLVDIEAFNHKGLSNIEIDLSEENQGVYFYRITQNGKMKALGKLVKSN